LAVIDGYRSGIHLLSLALHFVSAKGLTFASSWARVKWNETTSLLRGHGPDGRADLAAGEVVSVNRWDDPDREEWIPGADMSLGGLGFLLLALLALAALVY